MNEIRELDRKGLRDFGLLGGAIAAGLFGSLLPLLHHEPLPILPWLIATILWVWALIAPATLNGIYQIWMKIGLVLGWINTRIILGIVFYALLMPMGLVMRGVFHQDTMKRKLDADLATYRVIAQVKPRERMEKPF
ncbi:SxtJ family membrane protein [aff. Roholtiella sp. LEGE 12411]|uniref:SxtJ family membrane protein n=1 Tax=aff. Roholtiella sp. LEGE 12411 TaxID=1828822 RepID=UPI0018822A14|nr:SxtJ family membrane protein [aff. Roholtiella sp. LEGE 12411]MBE9035771.1 sxtJ [aff. Roholtiella sp. LEGE 12411]